MRSNFDKYPSIQVSNNNDDCIIGWSGIASKINNVVETKGKNRVVVVIDCYHGVLHEEIETELRNELRYDLFVKSTSAFKASQDVAAMVYPDVTDDQIFGFMTQLTIDKFFDDKKLAGLRNEIESRRDGVIVVYGEGAAHVASQSDVLIYIDMARWEIQLRMRKGLIDNLGVANAGVEFSHLYKQAYFVDWRVLDKHKMSFFDKIDFVIDTNKPGVPKMAAASLVRKGLDIASHFLIRDHGEVNG
jgi:hypothetical protein